MAPLNFVLYFLCLIAVFESDGQSMNLENNITNVTVIENHEQSLDDFQEYWSRKILIFSSNLDQMLSRGIEDDENLSVGIDNCFSKPVFVHEKDRETYQTVVGFDDFFKDEVHLDRNNQSYVKVSGGYEYDYRGKAALFHTLSARIKLPRTQEKLQIFIGDETQTANSLSHPHQPLLNEGIGIKYYFPSLYGRLFSNASVGFSGIDNPYVKTHIEYPVIFDHWLIKLSQNFKYSLENNFDEWTNIYFDRKLSDKEMLRILLQRSTNSEVRGMEYLSQISYMRTGKYDVGYTYYLSCSGRTKDLSDSYYDNGLNPREGVYEYTTGVIWRQKLMGDYLFYQIEPIVSFHEQYDYKSNYRLKFTFDLYFGKK
jgi:hypothetical protein